MGFPDRLTQPGPKRLLALDGGGLRGIISLAYLKQIENILRTRYGAPNLVLADYFDLIGGTSTGAIIATALSLGRSVEDIERLYLSLGTSAFQEKRSVFGKLSRIFRARFDDAPLAKLLQQELGERTLSSPDFRCGLMIVAKRADTGSVWPMVNIPSQKYFEFNKNLTLWELLRASTAAPTYFRPQLISDIGAGEEAVFVDGSMSMHGSPALLLFMVATMKGFGLGWPTGEDKLLLCSIGTGSTTTLASVKSLSADRNMSILPVVMNQLLSDATELNTTLLQWMSRSPTARVLDTQIGDLQDDLLAEKPLLTYLRYDLPLNSENLGTLSLNFTPKELVALQEIGERGVIPQLQLIGERSAAQVREEHFGDAFDLNDLASRRTA